MSRPPLYARVMGVVLVLALIGFVTVAAIAWAGAAGG
jgi:hypothetical protein